MDQFFRDLWAGVQIFHSNFTARYGALVNTVFLSAVAAVFLYALLRAIAAGRRGRRSASTLHQRQPDPVLTERAAESLAMAIRIPSVTGEPGPMGEMARFLKERYPNAARTMEFSPQPDGSLLLCWRTRERTDNDPVLFCGHLDVAPGGDGWTQCGPFEGLRSEGRIWGRGAMDCKGIVVAMLEAAEALIGADFSPRRDVYFAFGCDEETGGGQGAGAMARLLEKQGLQFSLVMDEGGAFQDIYRDGRYYSAAYIGMGEKRHCEYKLTVTAPGGHSSEPGRSTALGMLSEAVCRVESVQPHPHILPIVWDQLDETISTFPFIKRFFIANKPLLKLFSGRIFRDDPAVSALIRSTLAATKMDGSFPALNMLPLFLRPSAALRSAGEAAAGPAGSGGRSAGGGRAGQSRGGELHHLQKAAHVSAFAGGHRGALSPSARDPHADDGLGGRPALFRPQRLHPAVRAHHPGAGGRRKHP